MTFEIIMGFYVLVLATVAGYQLITKVPPTLHTPLMSGANAISGITILGAMYAASQPPQETWISTLVGCAAVALATINVVGGFLVTNRMLAMFGKKRG